MPRVRVAERFEHRPMVARRGRCTDHARQGCTRSSERVVTPRSTTRRRGDPGFFAGGLGLLVERRPLASLPGILVFVDVHGVSPSHASLEVRAHAVCTSKVGWLPSGEGPKNRSGFGATPHQRSRKGGRAIHSVVCDGGEREARRRRSPVRSFGASFFTRCSKTKRRSPPNEARPFRSDRRRRVLSFPSDWTEGRRGLGRGAAFGRAVLIVQTCEVEAWA
jgi:hypothetical protein